MRSLLITTVIATLFTALSGFSELANASEPEPNLVIFRTVEVAKTKGIHHRLTVNGEKVGKLKPDTVIALKLSPGQHTIEAADKRHSQIVINVSEDAVTYVAGSVQRDRNMDWSITEPTEEVLNELVTNEQVLTIR